MFKNYVVYSYFKYSSPQKIVLNRCELTQQPCMDKLNLILDNEGPPRFSVYRWYGEFYRGCSSLQGQFREGRPKLVVVLETIVTVR